jgi:hypothetical protein
MMTIWDILGSVAYTQLSVLIEGLVIVLCTVFLAILLPKKFLKERFDAIGGVIVLAVSAGLVFAHVWGDQYHIWNFRGLVLWSGAVLGLLLILSIGIYLLEKTQRIIALIVERFGVLGWVFLISDVISVFIVIWRNVI